MTKIVCQCGKGYGSPFDGLCRFCRENKFCPTRRDCKRFGIRRGEGLTLDQLTKGTYTPIPIFQTCERVKAGEQ